MKELLSRRTDPHADVNRLTLALEEARADGRPILDLACSNPTVVGIDYPVEGLLAPLADARAIRYEPHPLGLPAAREALAAHLADQRAPVDPQRILLTASTSEAYACLFKTLCDPGDEVLVPRPSYPLFDYLARFEGARPVSYSLRYDGRWTVDPQSFRAALTPRTKAVVAVSPNNPTGSWVRAADLELLSSPGLPLILDAVFSAYALSDAAPPRLDALGEREVPSFILGGLSKEVGLPQLKLAWTRVVGRGPAVEAALARIELVADAYLSPGTPVQWALPRLLERGREVQRAILARVRSNYAAIPPLLPHGSTVSRLAADGGWSAILRLPRLRSEEHWVLELLQRRRVHVHPGYFFDFPDEAYLVVSLLTPEETFAEGIRRLAAHVDQVALA